MQARNSVAVCSNNRFYSLLLPFTRFSEICFQGNDSPMARTGDVQWLSPELPVLPARKVTAQTKMNQQFPMSTEC